MGRKARAKKEPKSVPIAGPPTRSSPNWPLFALSVAGIVLAAYLSWTEWVGGSVKGCGVGSSCDLVLSSRWATLMGLPTALWGMIAYVTLAGTAFIKRVDRHWWAAWTVSFFGVFFSAYLTTVSLTILGAACPYCLTSLALMTAIFLLVTYQRPVTLEGFSWPRWLSKTAPVAAALIVVLHLNYTGLLGEPPPVEDPMARALAVHLTNSGAKMYGAYWCPHCQDQKALFGAAANRLPYIECSTAGQGSPQTETCRAEKIKTYPTWVINGKRTEEVMTLPQLAAASGFKPPARADEVTSLRSFRVSEFVLARRSPAPPSSDRVRCRRTRSTQPRSGQPRAQ
jgi:uncharacterized membrane protein/glutaredoxin